MRLSPTTSEQYNERDHNHLFLVPPTTSLDTQPVHRTQYYYITQQCEWMHLTQDRDQWQAPMNMVMNLTVQKIGEFLD